MLGTSLPALIFIRICIVGLSSVAPISIAYTVYALYTRKHLVPCPVEFYFAAEAAFYFLWYLPWKHVLQKPEPHPAPHSPEERRALFIKCLASIKYAHDYISGWFHGAPWESVFRENLGEFLTWGFLDRDTPPTSDDEIAELNEYIDMFEEKLGHRLPPGYNPKVVSLRLTIDPVRMSHRSLLWYWCVHVVDLLTSVRLWIHSFVLFPTAGWLRVFPGRPHARLFSNGGSSPAADLSYWYRPHTSKTDLPVVFLHGLGVGVYPYTPFLGEIAKEVGPGVGVFVVEMMPISTRVCHEAPTPEQFYEQMAQILDFHQVGSFVLVGHSYGTILATHLLHSRLAPRIDSLVLLDPICFLLHLPSVAYNFTTRPAKSANELQLEYFASLDPGIAHSICRHFFWTQNVLWKEELGERKCVVSVGGRDLIIDVEQVWEYLTDGQGGVVGQGMKKVWTGGKWSVHWFGDADHAQVFDTKERRKGLVDAVAELTRAVKSGYGTL